MIKLNHLLLTFLFHFICLPNLLATELTDFAADVKNTNCSTAKCLAKNLKDNSCSDDFLVNYNLTRKIIFQEKNLISIKDRKVALKNFIKKFPKTSCQIYHSQQVVKIESQLHNSHWQKILQTKEANLELELTRLENQIENSPNFDANAYLESKKDEKSSCQRSLLEAIIATEDFTIRLKDTHIHSTVSSLDDLLKKFGTTKCQLKNKKILVSEYALKTVARINKFVVSGASNENKNFLKNSHLDCEKNRSEGRSCKIISSFSCPKGWGPLRRYLGNKTYTTCAKGARFTEHRSVLKLSGNLRKLFYSPKRLQHIYH